MVLGISLGLFLFSSAQ